MRSVTRASLAAAALALIGAPAMAQQQVPLKLELPKPLFEGTPRPAKVANLEPPRKGPAPVFLVPAGTALLSMGKPVSSSDPLPVIGELAYVTDGKKQGTDGTFVELGPGPQWVQVDLGAPKPIAAVVMWHYHKQARVYHDVVVRVADDSAFTKNVRTLYNNDHDDSSKLGTGRDLAYVETNEGRTVDAKGEVARYVRLSSNGNTTDELNHYVEVEVYGKP
jgi:hypothetical protein